jgi:hypothetical protein
MSNTVVFTIGAVVFAITVWGTVMAGGLWFGRIVDSEASAVDPPRLR